MEEVGSGLWALGCEGRARPVHPHPASPLCCAALQGKREGQNHREKKSISGVKRSTRRVTADCHEPSDA